MYLLTHPSGYSWAYDPKLRTLSEQRFSHIQAEVSLRRHIIAEKLWEIEVRCDREKSVVHGKRAGITGESYIVVQFSFSLDGINRYWAEGRADIDKFIIDNK